MNLVNVFLLLVVAICSTMANSYVHLLHDETNTTLPTTVDLFLPNMGKVISPLYDLNQSAAGEDSLWISSPTSLRVLRRLGFGHRQEQRACVCSALLRAPLCLYSSYGATSGVTCCGHAQHGRHGLHADADSAV